MNTRRDVFAVGDGVVVGPDGLARAAVVGEVPVGVVASIDHTSRTANVVMQGGVHVALPVNYDVTRAGDKLTIGGMLGALAIADPEFRDAANKVRDQVRAQRGWSGRPVSQLAPFDEVVGPIEDRGVSPKVVLLADGERARVLTTDRVNATVKIDGRPVVGDTVVLRLRRLRDDRFIKLAIPASAHLRVATTRTTEE